MSALPPKADIYGRGWNVRAVKCRSSSVAAPLLTRRKLLSRWWRQVGVGKTTVARTLIDYFGANQSRPAFDTDSPRGTLKRFHPDVTKVVDVTSASDQMKIFDTLGSADAKVTVIDVRAGLLSPTLQALSDIGFLDRSRKASCLRRVPHPRSLVTSLEEIAETARFVGDANHFLVKNHINETPFFEWDPAT